LEEIDNTEENVSVTNTVNALEEDYTKLEINTEQSPKFENEVENVTVVEEIFEEGITEDDLEEEVSTNKQPEIEVITQQSTYVESNTVKTEASSATAEEDTLSEGPMLESTTFKDDLREITTEIITTSEGLPDNMTTTEYPIEEISTEQPTMFNKEERSTLTEDPAETTTAGRDDISSTEVVGMNKIKSEIAKSAEKEEKKDYVFTTEAPSEDGATNKQSTEKPTNIEDETVEVSTLETETRDFSTEQAFADLPPPTAFKDEILKNESSTEQPSTSKAVDEQPETSTATPGETSTITDANSEEISITEVIPEETTTFDSMAREFPSKEEIFDQDSYDFEIETTTIAFDEVATLETFTESSIIAFEAKTTGTTTSVANEDEGDISTSEVEVNTSATDFQTNHGQLNKQPETKGSPVGETTMVDVALLEEDTTRNNTHGESTTRNEVTTQASSTVVMTHTYVMQERRNVSWMEVAEISNEIPVDGQLEMKDDASSKLLDLVTQNFSEADNIIFDTEEIAPVNAPEDGIEDNKRVTITQHPSFLDRIQEERSRDQENKDGTTYRTEKSISKVVTQISV